MQLFVIETAMHCVQSLNGVISLSSHSCEQGKPCQPGNSSASASLFSRLHLALCSDALLLQASRGNGENCTVQSPVCTCVFPLPDNHFLYVFFKMKSLIEWGYTEANSGLLMFVAVGTAFSPLAEKHKNRCRLLFSEKVLNPYATFPTLTDTISTLGSIKLLKKADILIGVWWRTKCGLIVREYRSHIHQVSLSICFV